MKTKSLYIASLLVVGSVLTTLGKDAPSETGMALLSANGSQVVKVIYKAETAGKVKINIYNSASKLVYTDAKKSTEGFILPLNFEGLTFGEYTIELIDAAGSKTEKFNYQPASTNNNVRVSKVGTDGKFLLSVSETGNDNVTVKIYDEFNNLVHNASNTATGAFSQVYAIQNYTGSCTFEVTHNGQVTIVRF